MKYFTQSSAAFKYCSGVKLKKKFHTARVKVLYVFECVSVEHDGLLPPSRKPSSRFAFIYLRPSTLFICPQIFSTRKIFIYFWSFISREAGSPIQQECSLWVKDKGLALQTLILLCRYSSCTLLHWVLNGDKRGRSLSDIVIPRETAREHGEGRPRMCQGQLGRLWRRKKFPLSAENEQRRLRSVRQLPRQKTGWSPQLFPGCEIFCIRNFTHCY